MSQEEIYLATGKLVEDHRHSKSRLALLENELSRAADGYAAAATTIRAIIKEEFEIGTGGSTAEMELRESLQSVLPPDRLLALYSEYGAEEAKYADLERRKRNLNI